MDVRQRGGEGLKTKIILALVHLNNSPRLLMGLRVGALAGAVAFGVWGLKQECREDFGWFHR